MRGILFFLFAAMPLMAVAVDFPSAHPGGGFLSAQSFPSTFSDLSFTERMAVLKEGYEPFETKYDADGNCISGCAFAGMRIEDAEKYYRRQTEMANARADALHAQHPEWSAPAIQIQPTVVQVPTYVSGQASPMTTTATTAKCPTTAPHRGAIPSSQTVPTAYPMDGPVYITSSYGARTAPETKNGRHGTDCHRGVDLRAPVGTPVFATISGTVTDARYDKDCGNMVKIKSADGFAVGYCHLSQIMVRPGDSVSGGCVIGLSGNTGNSGGPHLHYMVYGENNAQICPDRFIPVSQNTSGRQACGNNC